MPYLSDTEESLRSLLHAVSEVGADYFYIDRLNPRYGVWPSLKGLLQEHLPHLTEKYKKILFSKPAREEYSLTLAKTVSKQARQVGLAGKMSLLF
jgi:hypothetical protein